MALLVVGGCNDFNLDPPLPCTTEFVSVDLAVVDSTGEAVPDVSIRVELARTGEVLDVHQYLTIFGLYIVADDSHMKHIGLFPERFIVTGTKDTLGFSTEYLIYVDSGRCHIHKVAGPDSVLIE
jgi:hypothetical protein